MHGSDACEEESDRCGLFRMIRRSHEIKWRNAIAIFNIEESSDTFGKLR
ncbi:MAG: hypothetical protein PT118_01525 [Aphanizomenon gracile PMC644.10]|nr:hypothetical protein [Aphanizomenon gracile PMC644.10]